TLLSPDRKIEAKVIVDNGQLKFAVERQGRAVIEPSPLAFVVDGVDLCAGITNVSATSGPFGDDVNETYATRGVHSTAVNRYHQTRMSLRHAMSNTPYTLQVRRFDDGVAYRFILDGKRDQSRTPDERSLFTLPAGSTLWYHGLRGHYEGDYVKRDVAEVAANEWLATPLTIKLPGGAGYASISESNLVNYSGFALQADGKRGFAIGLGHRQPVSYPYELRYDPVDVARVTQPAKIIGTITTPWRAVIVADNLNTLVNTDVISNLAAPPDKKLFPQGVATPWVKPGRAVWRYLDRDAPAPADPLPATTPARAVSATRPATTATSRPGGRGVTVDELKDYSRLAGELRFEYNVLEGFWSRWTDDQLRDLVAYSRQRGVGLFVWVHSKDLYAAGARAALFKRLRDTGIVGVKTDFFDTEHKEAIDLYHALLREGAENKILFDFHGANKPAGESRTWPNELVREAVRGMESRIKDRAQHNTTLPFTRFIVGPAEYTPVLFTERRGDTTWAHQVATAAVFSAPLLTYGAHPQKLLDSPAVDIIKSIPSTWDETRVLAPSAIGEVAVMARRKGGAWFLAVINGPDARRFDVPLDFLGDAKYRALVVSDSPAGPAAMKVATQSANRQTKLTIDLTAGGGFIARFDKE
ncbi:MAG: alpha-glucosidase, partial [Phycisphaerales bacterium]|nr:alpha-glucosidase [Phycisphaerales bacterium]